MKKLLLPICMSLSLACSSRGTVQPHVTVENTYDRIETSNLQYEEFTVLEKGRDSGITSPINLVFKSQNEYESHYRNYHSNGNYNQNYAPYVNFNTHNAVAIYLGRGTSNSDIEIESVIYDSARRTTTINYRASSQNNYYTSSSPYIFIKTNNHFSEYVFVRR